MRDSRRRSVGRIGHDLSVDAVLRATAAAAAAAVWVRLAVRKGEFKETHTVFLPTSSVTFLTPHRRALEFYDAKFQSSFDGIVVEVYPFVRRPRYIR